MSHPSSAITNDSNYANSQQLIQLQTKTGETLSLTREQITNLYEPNLKLVRELYQKDIIGLSEVDRYFYQFSQKKTYLIWEKDGEKHYH